MTATSDSGNASNPDVATDIPTKQCPYCAEEIRAAAIVCKHCGRDVKGEEKKDDKDLLKYSMGSILAGVLMVLLGFSPGLGVFLAVIGFAGLLLAIATR